MTENQPRFNSIEEADAWADAHRDNAAAPPIGRWYPNEDGEPTHAVPSWDIVNRRWNHHVCGACGERIVIYGVDGNEMHRYAHPSNMTMDEMCSIQDVELPTVTCDSCGRPVEPMNTGTVCWTCTGDALGITTPPQQCEDCNDPLTAEEQSRGRCETCQDLRDLTGG